MKSTLMEPIKCECEYCLEARWLKVRKPHGVRRMMVILHRHHMVLKIKKAACDEAAV